MPAPKKKKQGPLAVDSAVVLKSKLETCGALDADELLSFLQADKPACDHVINPCKQNRKDSPSCFCGFAPAKDSYRKKGLWQKDASYLNALGSDPRQTKREVEAMPAGLVNLGNTCYANAALQCMFAIPGIRNAIIQMPSAMAEHPVMGALQRLFLQMAFGPRCEVDTREFIDMLGINHGVQQDGQEFWKKLVEQVEKLFQQASVPGYSSLFSSLFKGQLCYRTTCMECGHDSQSSSVMTDFYELTPQVRGFPDLVDSLASSLVVEVLEGDNQYACDFCKKKVNALRRQQWKQLPPYLCLALQRFVWEDEKVKANDKLSFPLELNIRKVLAQASSIGPQAMPTSEGEVEPVPGPDGEAAEKYELVGVLIHKGNSASHGHYVAHLKDPATGKWLRFDDDVVSDMGAQPTGFMQDHGLAAPKEAADGNAKKKEKVGGKKRKSESKAGTEASKAAKASPSPDGNEADDENAGEESDVIDLADQNAHADGQVDLASDGDGDSKAKRPRRNKPAVPFYEEIRTKHERENQQPATRTRAPSGRQSVKAKQQHHQPPAQDGDKRRKPGRRNQASDEFPDLQEAIALSLQTANGHASDAAVQQEEHIAATKGTAVGASSAGNKRVPQRKQQTPPLHARDAELQAALMASELEIAGPRIQPTIASKQQGYEAAPSADSNAAAAETQYTTLNAEQNGFVAKVEEKAEGDLGSNAQLVTELTSANAYMLLYCLAGWPGKSTPLCKLEEAPVEAQMAVIDAREKFEKQCTEFERRKQEMVAAVEQRKEEVRNILACAPVSEAVDTPEESSDLGYWISSTWLDTWANAESKPPPIDNSVLLCCHGKGFMDPAQVSAAKRISSVAWQQLQATYGGGPAISCSQVCPQCIQAQLEHVTAGSTADIMRQSVSQALAQGDVEKLDLASLEGKVWVSRLWLTGWLRRSGTSVNIDKSPTEDIQCPHGRLRPAKVAGRTALQTNVFKFITDLWQRQRQGDLPQQQKGAKKKVRTQQRQSAGSDVVIIEDVEGQPPSSPINLANDDSSMVAGAAAEQPSASPMLVTCPEQGFLATMDWECSECAEGADEAAVREVEIKKELETERAMLQSLNAGSVLSLEANTEYRLIPGSWVKEWRAYSMQGTRRAAGLSNEPPVPRPPPIHSALVQMMCTCHQDRLGVRPPQLASKRNKWFQAEPEHDPLRVVSMADWQSVQVLYSAASSEICLPISCQQGISASLTFDQPAAATAAHPPGPICLSDIENNDMVVLEDSKGTRKRRKPDGTTDASDADAPAPRRSTSKQQAAPERGSASVTPEPQPMAAGEPAVFGQPAAGSNARLLTMPAVCDEAVARLEREAKQARLAYDDVEVMVEVVTAEDIKGGAKEGAGERKSRRARKGRQPVKVSSATTLQQLKYHIWQTLNVHPKNQQLYFGSRPIEVTDGDVTLSALELEPDMEIRVVHKGLCDDDDWEGALPDSAHKGPGGRRREEGFRGTFLEGDFDAVPKAGVGKERDSEGMEANVNVTGTSKELADQLVHVDVEANHISHVDVVHDLSILDAEPNQAEVQVHSGSARSPVPADLRSLQLAHNQALPDDVFVQPEPPVKFFGSQEPRQVLKQDGMHNQKGPTTRTQKQGLANGTGPG